MRDSVQRIHIRPVNQPSAAAVTHHALPPNSCLISDGFRYIFWTSALIASLLTSNVHIFPKRRISHSNSTIIYHKNNCPVHHLLLGLFLPISTMPSKYHAHLWISYTFMLWIFHCQSINSALKGTKMTTISVIKDSAYRSKEAILECDVSKRLASLR